MRYTVSAPDAPLHAGIQLPASKSISNRALILHALAHGKPALVSSPARNVCSNAPSAFW